jgi:hypothetical protein
MWPIGASPSLRPDNWFRLQYEGWHRYDPPRSTRSAVHSQTLPTTLCNPSPLGSNASTGTVPAGPFGKFEPRNELAWAKDQSSPHG